MSLRFSDLTLDEIEARLEPDLAEPDRQKDRFCDLLPVRHKSPVPSAEVLPCGLINPGNLSFLNATLQSLMACSPFVRLLQELRETNVSMVKFPCLAAFYKLANEVSLPTTATREKETFVATGSPFYPDMFDEVLKIFTPHVFPPGARPREEDAQKFLSFVMKQMHDELLELEGKSSHNGVESSLKAATAQTSDSSKLSSVFGGMLCSARSRKENASAFIVLSLDISHSRVVALKDALNQFCSRDRTSITSGPSANDFRIGKLPEILILHLNRFPLGSTNKVVKPLMFPSKLVLDNSVFFTLSKKARQVNYELISTISHHGNQVSKGHYTAHALYPNGQWLRFDDASVTAIDTRELPLKNAFILFYKKEE